MTNKLHTKIKNIVCDPAGIDFKKRAMIALKNLVTALKAEKANTKTGWKETKGNKLSWDEFRDKHGEPQEEGYFEGSPPSKEALARNEETLKRMKDMSKPEPKIDINEERVDPVSIWKDVSELPEICGAYFIKWKNLSGIQIGYFYAGNKTFYQNSNYNEGDELNKRHMEKCCLLTDFINSFEQMQKDIEEFKRK